MRREKIEEFNPWWFTGNVPAELLLAERRDLFATLEPFLEKRQIISIVGLRRTGKTTLLYQLIDTLLKAKTDPRTILYVSFDEKADDLDEILALYRDIHGIDFRRQRVYLFLDEIQKLSDWPDRLKTSYDLYPRLKIVLSGSEALFLSVRTKETLAGRIYEFTLPTLSFKEFIRLKGLSPARLPTAQLASLFDEYIRKGGFPETIGMDAAETKMYITSAVIDKIIFQDIVRLAGIKDTDLLKTLIEILALNPGMYLEYQSLAKQLGRDRRTIASYIRLLEQSFLVKLLRNYRKGRLSSLRKIKRIYLTDTSIIAAYKGAIDDQFFGRMVESAVIAGRDSRFFWKNAHEVDVIDKEPIEVKYTSKVIDRDLLGIRECMRKFSFSTGLVLTKDQEGTIKVPEGRITFTPVWKFLLGT